jgi:hypothetical protein
VKFPGPTRRTGNGAIGQASSHRALPRLYSRAKRWRDAISELTTLQGHYAAWLEALPENLQDSATAEALQAICDLDLTELQAIVPSRGFGRD